MDLAALAKTASGSAQTIRGLWDAPLSGGAGRPTLARTSWNVGFPEAAGHLAGDAGTAPVLDQPYTVLAAAALRLGEAFLTLDIAGEGTPKLEALLAALPAGNDGAPETRAVRAALRQLGHAKALALARTGSTAAAQRLLENLVAQDGADGEITAALARTYKDLGASAERGSALRASSLRRSFQLYARAYRASRPRSYFLGVNAAALALWTGRGQEARALASEVEALCRAELAAGGESAGNDYWLLATLSEVALLQGQTEPALGWLARARAIVGSTKRWADLGSTRGQFARHLAGLGGDPAPFEAAFAFPRLAVFSGHMIDAPGRATPRFPDEPALVASIRAEIGQRLEAGRVGFAVGSAASGADLLVIEEMLRRGGEVHVVLPWRETEFIASSIAPGGPRWLELFQTLRPRFASLTCLSQQTLPSEQGPGFEYCNQCLCGMGLQRARTLGAEVLPLAVWDGLPGDGPGGTASFVDFWRELGRPPEVVSLPAPAGENAARPGPPRRRFTPARGEIRVSRGQPAVKTLLFADVVGYSKITEAQIEHFAPQFLGAVSELIAGVGLARPILSNTWGDAIYLVFDDAPDAGAFALRLRTLIQGTDWGARGLPAGLNVRVGLHTGPVLLCVDPVIRQMTFTGSHVSHAARIEPVVAVGEVYGTEAFVAAVEIARARAAVAGDARAEGVAAFGYDYLGQIEFAKGYGRYPLFRLRAAESVVALPPGAGRRVRPRAARRRSPNVQPGNER